MTMNNVSDLVGKVQKSLINTFGRLPDVRDVNISTIAEGDKTFLVVECTKKFKGRLKSIIGENDYTVFYTDFDSSISELRKEIQYVEDCYNAPVEVLDTLVREVNDKLGEYKATITELRNELNFLTATPAVVNPDFGKDITTPFSDDLGNEDNYCYPRELGEVHDTFNVVINQGSGNPITLTRVVIRSSQDDGSYLQSMVDVLSKLRN